MPDPGHIRFASRDGAATITLNRPEKRNAISQEMLETISASLATAAADPAVRVLVIEGVPGIFCAGGDLARVKHADPAVTARYQEMSHAMHAAIRGFPQPTVAVIDGLCIGGGCNIALACDIRIGGPQASFAIPAVRHGIAYDQPTVTRLVDLVGPGQASHLLFTAGRIGLDRAAAIGLVDVACADVASELAAFLDAVRAADPAALAATRASIRRARS